MAPTPTPTPIIEVLTETLKITIPQPTSAPIIIEIPLPVQVPIPASLPPIAPDGALPPAIPPVVFPVPIPLGQSIVLVNNEPVAVTVTAVQDEATNTGIVSIQGAGFNVNFAAAAPDGTPLPLGTGGQLRLVIGGQAALQGGGFRPDRVIDIYLILPPGTGTTAAPTATAAAAAGGVRFVQAASIVKAGISEGEAVLIGRAPVDADGNFVGTVPVPTDLPPGDYTLQARGAAKGKGATVRTISMGVTVEAPPATASPTPTSSGGEPSASASASSGGAVVAAPCSQDWCLQDDWLSWLIIGALLLLLIVLWIIGLASRRSNRAGVVGRDPVLAIVLGLATLAGVVATALGVLSVISLLAATIALAVLAVIAGIVISVRIAR